MDQRSSHLPTSHTVSRAIARSRAVRASVARRRRRALALAACAAALVGVPVVWTMAGPAAVVAAAAASEVRSLADLMSQRSPGTRTQAELTKHARAASKLRAGPKHAERPWNPLGPEAPQATALVDLLLPPLAPVGVVSQNVPPPLAPPPTLGGIIGSIDQPSGPPGGGGGGGPVHFPTSEPRDVPPSAVPEPGTWTMMLTGFVLVAWRMRRRRPAILKKAKRASA